MSTTMIRRCLTAAVALAAVAAVATLAPVSSAEAGAAVSPFAGNYVGSDPQGWHGSWAVTISDKGRVTSSYSGLGHAKGSISGRIDPDGSYSFTVSETVLDQIPNWRDNGPSWVTLRYTATGTMVLDADGNLVGTPETGASFTWLRQ
jgi:hypothetical protein